jgi:hypothetical protein
MKVEGVLFGKMKEMGGKQEKVIGPVNMKVHYTNYITKQ